MRQLINPSLLWSNGKLLRAARAHAVSAAVTNITYQGQPATELLSTWHSDIAYDESIATANASAWAGWQVEAWGLDGVTSLRRLQLHRGDEAWGPLCDKYVRFHPENRTLTRSVVTGPEDPKLAVFPASFASSGEAATEQDVVRLVFSSLRPADLFGCNAWNLWPRGQESKYSVFQSVNRTATSHGGTYRAEAVRLPCGYGTQDEKNWISFVHDEKCKYP